MYYTEQDYSDVIVSAMASQITGISIVRSTVFFSAADQRKHQSSASAVDFPHKGPVTRKMFPFDDVIMNKSKQSYVKTPYFVKWFQYLSSLSSFGNGNLSLQIMVQVIFLSALTNKSYFPCDGRL